MKRVTLKDLAEAIGVSQNTVSLVLRGRPGISEDTRERILQTAREMGYHERKRSTEMPNICVLTTYKNNIDSYYFGRLQKQIESYLNRHDCMTITVNNVETYSLEAIQDLCEANDIEGIILVADVGRRIMAHLKELNIPIVCAGFYVPGMDADSVMEDNIVGVSLMMEQIKSRGITKAGFIGSILTDQGFFERWMTAVAMSSKLDMVMELENCILNESHEKLGTVVEVIDMLSKMESLPEAFVCANDKIAITVIKALQHMGKKIPEEISVVGFDNGDLAMLSTPTVATIDNFSNQQAKSAVKRLIRRLKDPRLPYERILCAIKFIDGDSLKRTE